MEDDYTYWRRALNGERPEIHADEPQCGFYRVHYSSHDPLLPVAIWRDAGTLQCKVGYDSVFRMDDPFNVWTWCGDRPVPYSLYRQACRTHKWPHDEVASVALFERAAEVLASEEQDGGELETLWLRLEACRKAENKHHLQAKKEIDGKFKEWQEKIKEALKRLKEEDHGIQTEAQAGASQRVKKRPKGVTQQGDNRNHHQDAKEIAVPSSVPPDYEYEDRFEEKPPDREPPT